MYYKFIYLDRKTGKTIYSQKELENKNFKLIKGYKDTSMKSSDIKKK